MSVAVRRLAKDCRFGGGGEEENTMVVLTPRTKSMTAEYNSPMTEMIKVVTPATPATEGLPIPPTPSVTQGMSPAFFRLLLMSEAPADIVEELRSLGAVGEQVLYAPLQMVARGIAKLRQIGSENLTNAHSVWSQVCQLRNALARSLIMHVQSSLLGAEHGVAALRTPPKACHVLLSQFETLIDQVWQQTRLHMVTTAAAAAALTWVDDETTASAAATAEAKGHPAPTQLSLCERLQARLDGQSDAPAGDGFIARVCSQQLRKNSVLLLQKVNAMTLLEIVDFYPQLEPVMRHVWQDYTCGGSPRTTEALSASTEKTKVPTFGGLSRDTPLANLKLSPHVFRRAQGVLSDLWSLFAVCGGPGELYAAALTAGYCLRCSRVVHWKEIEGPGGSKRCSGGSSAETVQPTSPQGSHYLPPATKRRRKGAQPQFFGILSLMGARGAPRGGKYTSMISTVHKAQRTRERKKRAAEAVRANTDKDDSWLYSDLNLADNNHSAPKSADKVADTEGGKAADCADIAAQAS